MTKANRGHGKRGTGDPRQVAIAVALALSALAWIAWMLSDRAPSLTVGSYLTKDATRAEIGRAVLAAAAGQAVLDPAVQQRLLSAAVLSTATPTRRTADRPARFPAS